MLSEELTGKIEEIGFSEFESKIFISVYTSGRQSATEISKSTGIKRATVYGALKTLIEKGIINEFKTPSKREFEIIDRKIIEDKIIISIEESSKKRLKNAKECFEQLKPLYKKDIIAGNKPKVEILKGYNRHREQNFLKLMINSKKSIYMMNRYYGNTDVKIDEAAAKFIKNGGIIKSLYETGEKMKIKTGEHSFKKFDKKELIDLCRKFRQTVKTLD